MKQIIHQMIVGLSAVFCMSTFSYIYEVKTLKKWNAKTRRYDYFVGLSDFHDKTDPSNQIQLQKIKQVLKHPKQNNIKVAIEDLSSVNINGTGSCGRYTVNSRGGVLGGLAQTCKDMALAVSNVEFRYCRVVALGPVLNNIGQDINSFPSVKETGMKVIIEEIENQIKHIQSNTIDPRLQQYYDTTIHAIKNEMKKLHMYQSDHLSVAEYLEKYSTSNNRLEVIKNLLTFDSALLDLIMVQVALSAPGSMVGIAGGAHIGRTGDMLQMIGYKDVNTTKISFGRENNLQKCLGSNIIDGAFCIKPQPISLDFIDTFFPQIK